MTVRRVVRERIDPRLIAALFANDRTPIDAVLELVDNAVDSRVAGRRRRPRKSAATAGRIPQAGLWR